MAKFNIVDRRRLGPNGPITASPTPDTRTHLGAPGHTRDVKSELFLLATTNFVGEETFHEAAGARDKRFSHLVREVALFDAAWLADFLNWLRRTGNMRTAPIVAACDAVAARLAAGLHGGNRQLIAAAPGRADEPGELLAYWRKQHGRKIPKPVKRGLGDAVNRLYTERATLKWDTDGNRAYRFADVIELVHPKPDSQWRSALFEHCLARRRRRAELFRHDPLPTLIRRRDLNEMPAEQRRDWLRDAVASGRAPDRLRAAGMTWEALSGWLNGPMDADAWEAIAPTMGLLALARNLRNFDEAGLSDTTAAHICARFADPAEVAASRMFPYRWFAAYEQAPSLRWGHALDQALHHSLRNLPDLEGRTLILVDTSGSMQYPMANKSKMNRIKAAAVFGVGLATRLGARADLHGFADSVFRHDIPAGASAIEQVRRFCDRVGEVGHGTRIAGSLRRAYSGHDRVFLFSDMQTMDADVTRAVPEKVKLYGFNLAGYRPTAIPAGNRNRIEFGGLGDATFTIVPLIERGQRAGWPWELEATQ